MLEPATATARWIDANERVIVSPSFASEPAVASTYNVFAYVSNGADGEGAISGSGGEGGTVEGVSTGGGGEGGPGKRAAVGGAGKVADVGGAMPGGEGGVGKVADVGGAGKVADVGGAMSTAGGGGEGGPGKVAGGVQPTQMSKPNALLSHVDGHPSESRAFGATADPLGHKLPYAASHPNWQM